MVEKDEVTTTVAEMGGVFVESLLRNNKQIRKDRGQAIAETAEMLYKRAVEDIQVEIRQVTRDRENMLDLSPENATSLKLASDFDAAGFVAKDIDMGVRLRLLEIKYDLAKKQYNRLFGGK